MSTTAPALFDGAAPKASTHQRRRKVLKAGAVFTLIAWIAGVLWLTRAGDRTELRKVDCIIVPGARALKTGPGPSLQARIDRAVELWKAGWAPNLLVTGGLGVDERVEGLTARAEAIRQGVPAANIAWEGRSKTTWQNFYFAHRVMLQRGWKSCLVCTDPFHEPRCIMIAQSMGIEAYPAPTYSGPGWNRTSTWLFFSTREALAFLKWGINSELGRPD